MTILGPFGSPWAPFWHHFAIKRATDAHRGTLEGPKLDFQRFLMDLGSPFGDHFGSLFDIFCYLKRQKACLDCRHDYCRLLNWNYADFWCPHLSIYIANTDVFIRFRFFLLFHEFDDFRYLFGPYFHHFWRSWEVNLMIFRVLEIAWNFNEFQGLTRDTQNCEDWGAGR